MRPALCLLFACGLFLAGCALSSDDIAVLVPVDPTPPAQPETEPEPTPAPTATPARSATPTPADGGEPPTQPPQGTGFELRFESADAPGLVTDTDVPVAVLARLPDGLIVRTPCGRSAVIARSGRPLADIAVVLDPGHGGPIDTGAQGANGLVERDLNLRLALAAESELSRLGISVALTRRADYATTLPTRAGFADHLDAELMVSIHHNAPTFTPSTTPGSEIFVQNDSPASRRLGGLLYAELVDALDDFEDVEWTAAPDAGVLAVLNSEGTDAYGMVRRPETVAVLAELAYLANPPEAELLATPEYIDVAARALARGIEAYLSNPSAQGRGFQPARTFDPSAAPGEDECVDPPLE